MPSQNKRYRDPFPSEEAEEAEEAEEEAATPQEEIHGDSDFDEEAAAARNMPLVAKNGPRKRRQSISAGAELKSGLKVHMVKRIEKSDEDLQNIDLKKIILFQHLDKKQSLEIKEAMTKVRKEKDEVIIKEGEEGDNLYIIESGTVEVYKISDGCSSPFGELVKTYDDEGYFGELAIMYNSPRAATCIARSTVHLFVLARKDLKAILTPSHP